MQQAGIVLRITWVRSESANRLKVEGEITGPESGVFWGECRKGIAQAARFEIDLGGVTWLDNYDADRLRELARGGVEIVDCSAFVWALLNHQEGKLENVALLCSGKARRRRGRRPPPEIV